MVLGLDLEPLFKEVHKTNMTKIPATDPGGKILKGENFTPPNLSGLINEQRTSLQHD